MHWYCNLLLISISYKYVYWFTFIPAPLSFSSLLSLVANKNRLFASRDPINQHDHKYAKQEHCAQWDTCIFSHISVSSFYTNAQNNCWNCEFKWKSPASCWECSNSQEISKTPHPLSSYSYHTIKITHSVLEKCFFFPPMSRCASVPASKSISLAERYFQINQSRTRSEML